MVLKDAVPPLSAPFLAQVRRARRAASWRELVPVTLLGLLALALTVIYYASAYQAHIRADDRIRDLFAGFQSLEGEAHGLPYRWTMGSGTVCLPAMGLTRPLAALDLRLLGSAVTAGSAGRAVDYADVRVGALSIPLAIAPEHRAYHLLLPPAPEGGPLCVTLLSATVDPSGNGRVVGVGVRSVAARPLERGALPPPGALLANLGLALGSYGVLRRLGIPQIASLGLVASLSVALGAGLIGGAIRLAPDLPYWSAFTAVALGLIFSALVAYQRVTPRLGPWQRETLGVLLILGLMSLGWYVLAHREGYAWPFPLMARAGGAFGWGILPAAALFGAFAAAILTWLRAPDPPAPGLVIAATALAAALLPATLKVGLRGYPSLFQHFAEQSGNYIHDVPRVGNDPLGFLRGYVASMPDLVLHNKTHPPGSTLFLWGIERLFGPGPEPATWAVIIIAALGVWPTYRLTAALAGQRAAILAAAIYAVLPAFMIYAATSMDALYATVLAWAIYSLYRALVILDQPDGPPAPQLLAALAAGAWIALGLLFSFTTLMLALVVAALVARRLALGPRRLADALRWAAIGAALAGAVLLPLGALWLATGYNSLAAFFSGVANNRLDVEARVSPLGLSSYLFFLAVNTVAYAWFLGPWLIYRLGRDGLAQMARICAGIGRPADALGLGLMALLLGMLFSGLFYREIERVWLFSHILIAATLADGIMEQYDRRGNLAALILLSLFAHSVIFRSALRVSW
ncbi:MAG: glycosyltransferase family 39 protein [Oscillochloridaceae bacterium]|nr:glycosyltransferase family 39 protein [Chloroflexaceae bacterium]MDW8391855.1 glycosyltransferase family 39 protein [Oscillochloridaceae bacterium]